MSSQRILSASRLARAGQRSKRCSSLRTSREHVRWQSNTRPPPNTGSKTGNFLTYTALGSFLAVTGGTIYANYDHLFKIRVDQYVPGFARFADTAADLYVGAIDSIGLGKKEPKPEVVDSGLRSEKRKNVQPGSIFRHEGKKKGFPQPREKEAKKSSNSPAPFPPATSEAQQSITQESSAAETLAQEEKSLEEEVVDASQPPVSSAAEEKEESGAIEEQEIRVVSEEEGEKRQPQQETVVAVKVGKVAENSELEQRASSVETREAQLSVESSVAAAKEETARVAEEMKEEKIREHQEAQMSDEHLSWLKDSAQVGGQLDESYEKFVALASAVLNAQQDVVDATKQETRLLKEVTGQQVLTSENVQSSSETADAISKARDSVMTARETLKEALAEQRHQVDTLRELMNSAMELGLKSKVEEMEGEMSEKVAQLVEGSAAMKEAEMEKEVLKHYQQETERTREQLQRELGTELPEGDSRQEALLLLLGKRVEVLQNKLQGLEKEHAEKLSMALERQKDSLDELAEQRLRWSLQKKERDMDHELKYMVEKMDREYQNELREQLRIQTDTHTQHLSNALQTQADKLGLKWSHELELKMKDQEGYYHKELARTKAQLQGIEYMINTIAHAGNETRRQQSLRAACDSFHTALQSASANPDPDHRHTFTQEVTNLREVAKEEPFIVTLLDSLPTSATGGEGLQCERALSERFGKVKRMCRRVALVPESGGGLGTYALSYLQSALIVSWRFVGRGGRGAGGGDDFDPREMDTFEVLDCAEMSLQQGDVEQAVRYINLLRGEPRRVASDWLHDARHYLETNQAVVLLSHYMAALNISHSPPQ